MTTVEKIKRFLDDNTKIESHIAGTGSLYIYYNDSKIRISNHEEASTRLRESAEKCFYTKTADNREFEVIDVIGDIFDYLSDNYDFDFTNELKMKLFELE